MDSRRNIQHIGKINKSYSANQANADNGQSDMLTHTFAKTR